VGARLRGQGSVGSARLHGVADRGHGVRAIPLSDVEPIAIGLARRREDSRAVVAALFDIALDLVAKHDEEVARALRAPAVAVPPAP